MACSQTSHLPVNSEVIMAFTGTTSDATRNMSSPTNDSKPQAIAVTHVPVNPNAAASGQLLGKKDQEISDPLISTLSQLDFNVFPSSSTMSYRFVGFSPNIIIFTFVEPTMSNCRFYVVNTKGNTSKLIQSKKYTTN